MQIDSRLWKALPQDELLATLRHKVKRLIAAGQVPPHA
jgi:hypothetical protein